MVFLEDCLTDPFHTYLKRFKLFQTCLVLTFHLVESHLHVLLSQPFIAGCHPDWEEMVARLENQGLMHERQGSQMSRFWVDGGEAGRILVTDVHEDNVIVTSSGAAHPIDVHFSFRSRDARLLALQKLGLWP